MSSWINRHNASSEYFRGSNSVLSVNFVYLWTVKGLYYVQCSAMYSEVYNL